MRAAKGSRFEREISKQLSRWWTGGERDDVFWRSSQSGGRATQRAKRGVRTYGSCGDLTALDPIGEPLLKMFTIELKRGSSYKYSGDLLDFKPENIHHPWVQCLLQAIRSHEQAGSRYWMLISRRDHRQAIVYLPNGVLRMLRDGKSFSLPLTAMKLHLVIQKEAELWGGEVVDVEALPLEAFLKLVAPEQIIDHLKTI